MEELLLFVATYFVKLPRIENSFGIPKAMGERREAKDERVDIFIS